MVRVVEAIAGEYSADIADDDSNEVSQATTLTVSRALGALHVLLGIFFSTSRTVEIVGKAA